MASPYFKQTLSISSILLGLAVLAIIIIILVLSAVTLKKVKDHAGDDPSTDGVLQVVDGALVFNLGNGGSTVTSQASSVTPEVGVNPYVVAHTVTPADGVVYSLICEGVGSHTDGANALFAASFVSSVTVHNSGGVITVSDQVEQMINDPNFVPSVSFDVVGATVEIRISAVDSVPEQIVSSWFTELKIASV